MLIQTCFLVPLTDEFTGDLHPYSKFEQLEKELFVAFDGWTDGGVVQGCWKDPDTGKPVYDRSKKYIMAIEQNDVPKLRRFLKKVKNSFGQKALYFEAMGIVEFI